MSNGMNNPTAFLIRTLQVHQLIDSYEITPIHIQFAHGHKLTASYLE